MGQGLSNKQPGGVDQTFKWLLHLSGNAVAAGAQVADGDGNDTGLKIWSNKIGIVGATNTVSLGFTGASDRAITLPDADGELLLKETALAALGLTRIELGANVDNATQVQAAVAGMEFLPEASSLYTFEMYLLLSSSASSSAIQLQIDGPTAQTDFVSYQVHHSDSTTTLDEWVQNAFGVEMNPGNTPESSHVPTLTRITGVLKTTATTPASAVQVSIAAESAAQTARIHGGSVLKFTKI